MESTAKIAVIACALGCLVVAALHGIPLVLPILIGGAVGMLARWLPLALRSARALVRRDRIE